MPRTIIREPLSIILLTISASISEPSKRDEIIQRTLTFFEYIKDVYKNLEPIYLKGRLMILTMLDETSNIPDEIDKNSIHELSDLAVMTGDEIIIYYASVDAPIFTIENRSINEIKQDSIYISYVYENGNEYININGESIPISGYQGRGSVFCTFYNELDAEILRYKNERILESTCCIFNNSWFNQGNRIFFKNSPEDLMQLSLQEFLRSTMRGVNVSREINVDARKPVDLRLQWREANRMALIEIKWLGKSLSDQNIISATYTDARANDGALQLKEYLDSHKHELPTSIIRAYLVVIDGRRWNTSIGQDQITRDNGFRYENQDIKWRDDRKYHCNNPDYAKPVRMFTRPICN